jgi:hypothetical protein
MGEENHKLLSAVVILAVLVIVISLASFGVQLTGRATDTAVVNVTVSSAATINFTDDFINFGVGQVTAGDNATLDSNDTSATNGNWSWSADYFTLENIGNSNVSVELKTSSNATTFLGGTDPAFRYSFVSGETGSCVNQSATGIWLDVNVTDPGTPLCNPLYMMSNNDTINISVQLIIPTDSYTGTLTSTFTATGTTV